jgi:hypothetical protein
MIERTIIVIVSIAAIIFVPYWIGWLLVKPKSTLDNRIGNWLLGALISTVFLFIVCLMVLHVLPYIINGSV